MQAGRSRRKSWIAWVALLHAAWAFAACRRDPPVIGVPHPPPGPSVLDVVRQSVADFPGGPPATMRGPVSTQETYSAREVDVATQLAAVPGIVAVVGHQDSRSALLAAPVYDEAGIPLVVPNATSRALGAAGRWVFPVAPSDSQEGAFIAAFATRVLGARRMTLLYDNDEYGRGLRDGVRDALAAADTPLLADAPIGAVCAVDGDATVALITSHRPPPDLLVLAARQADVACIVRQARRRLPGLRFITGDAVEINDGQVAAMGAAAESTYFVAFWYDGLTDARSTAFTSAYRRVTGTHPSPATALQYDALMLLMTAVRDVGGNRKAIQTYLSDLGRSRPAYEGVTGPISFDAGRQRPMYMLRVRGGATVAVPGP
ncbi:MAG TPA: branched-chain amino acid ABC transporter substrate-binding protein [Gemmatimonadales bacterium]|nr:branched-chain amino acid ABC transporter substrate-binding protein [Gemmatimonadales bacterium]